MKRLLLPWVMLFACGGQTAPAGDAGGNDASDAGGDGPIVVCHGYCPQPNGSQCASDCDCYDKCLTGKDTPPTCEVPVVQAIPCGDAAACPSGQTCGVFGVCEGATCASGNQCPSQQSCMNGACKAVGCI